MARSRESRAFLAKRVWLAMRYTGLAGPRAYRGTASSTRRDGFRSAKRMALRPRNAFVSSRKASWSVPPAVSRSCALGGRRSRSAENSEVAEEPPEQDEDQHGRKTAAAHLLRSITRGEAA